MLSAKDLKRTSLFYLIFLELFEIIINSALCSLLEPSVFEPVTSSTFKLQSGYVTMSTRKVVKSVLSVEQDEGLGARVRRSVGRAEVSAQPSSFTFHQ